MTESEWHGRVNFGRLQEYFGRVAESDHLGRISMTESDYDNCWMTLAESEWSGRMTLAESDFNNCWMTLAESEWSGRIALADSEWLNPKPWLLQSEISYTNRHQLVFGAPDFSAHA